MAHAEQLGPAEQFGWGAFGGVLPVLLQIIRLGRLSFQAPFPVIGWGYVAALAAAAIVGAVASRAFRAHNMIAAIYHGATAPITFAFVTGLNTH
jgi:hypothetical protein